MIVVEVYSEKAIAVFGDNLRNWASQLEQLGGKENPRLKGTNNTTRYGWIFSIKRKEEIERAVAEWNKSPKAKEQQSETASPPKSKAQPLSEYAQLLKRVEVLEAQLALILSQLSGQPKSKPSIQFDEEESDSDSEPVVRLLRK
jgi:hypothetical protein